MPRGVSNSAPTLEIRNQVSRGADKSLVRAQESWVPFLNRTSQRAALPTSRPHSQTHHQLSIRASASPVERGPSPQTGPEGEGTWVRSTGSPPGPPRSTAPLSLQAGATGQARAGFSRSRAERKRRDRCDRCPFPKQLLLRRRVSQNLPLREPHLADLCHLASERSKVLAH